MDPTAITPRASHYFWLALALLVLTVYGSLIPLHYHPMPLEEALERFQNMGPLNLSPTEPRADWVVNMFQYAALSFCFMAALAVDRRRWAGLWALVVVPTGLAVAVATEFAQVYFPPRTVSANDIAVEGVGVLVGCGAWLLVGQRVTDWLRDFWSRKGLAGLAEQALPAYLAGLLVVHLMPFDVVLSAAELEEKMAEGRIFLVPFSDLASGKLAHFVHALTNAAAFAPIGALLALLPRWSGRGGRAPLVLGLALALTVELLQLVVYTRYCIMTDVFTGTGGVLLGWALVRALRTGPATARGEAGDGPGRLAKANLWSRLALAWVAFLLLANWYPYDFSVDPARFGASDAELSDESVQVFGLRRMSWAPFADYYWGSRYQALDQILHRSLVFMPLGVFLALAFGACERRGAWVTFLGALVLAVLIEVGQYFIPQRHASVTDVLIEVFGAWLGYKLTRHVAHALAAPAAAAGAARRERVPAGAYSAAAAFGPTPPRGGPQIYAPWSPRGYREFDSQESTLTEELLRWFDSRPDWVKMAIICLIGCAVPLAVVMLLVFLGKA